MFLLSKAYVRCFVLSFMQIQTRKGNNEMSLLFWRIFFDASARVCMYTLFFFA